MFQAEAADLRVILSAYGIEDTVVRTDELLRYKYEADDPASREVRLILKVCFERRCPVVVKFKNEENVTRELIEKQTEFSQRLLNAGIPTARFYSAGGAYTQCRTIGGYKVWITVEDFMEGEIKIVTPEIARKTGRLLAMTHNVAEWEALHVPAPVLFNPFAENDLFSYDEFAELCKDVTGEDKKLVSEISGRYREHMQVLERIEKREAYAVQGDISDCNLFMTESGEIGMFDFNRCGDNILFCDAMMQGMFEARLMDYERPLSQDGSDALLSAFLTGYHRERPFSSVELQAIPRFYAVISAFWLFQILYGDESLKALLEWGAHKEVSELLQTIRRQISQEKKVELEGNCIKIT